MKVLVPSQIAHATNTEYFLNQHQWTWNEQLTAQRSAGTPASMIILLHYSAVKTNSFEIKLNETPKIRSTMNTVFISVYTYHFLCPRPSLRCTSWVIYLPWKDRWIKILFWRPPDQWYPETLHRYWLVPRTDWTASSRLSLRLQRHDICKLWWSVEHFHGN